MFGITHCSILIMAALNSCPITPTSQSLVLVYIIFFIQFEIFQVLGIRSDFQLTWKFWILHDETLNCFNWLTLLWQQTWPGLLATAGWGWETSTDTSPLGEVGELHPSSPCDVYPHHQCRTGLFTLCINHAFHFLMLWHLGALLTVARWPLPGLAIC